MFSRIDMSFDLKCDACGSGLAAQLDYGNVIFIKPCTRCTEAAIAVASETAVKLTIEKLKEQKSD